MVRRYSRAVKVGDVWIGGTAPVTVQSMTTTRTADVDATVRQIWQLQEAGCDIVRAAVPDKASAAALKAIVAQIGLPLVADIHFDYRLALAALEAGVDKLRINPGNIGPVDEVEQVAKAAKERRVPIRIGVNAGSVDRSRYGLPTPDALAESAMDEARVLERVGFEDIVISAKAFDVPTTIRAYELVAGRCDYPLHLGVTEAGLAWEGTIRSSVGIGALLAEGIGDTLRVSLTADPVDEVKAGLEILNSLGLRRRPFTLISCPTCGRCQVDLRAIAEEVRRRLEKHPPSRPVTVAVMGCVVNGPGEASMADLGIAGGKDAGAIFVGGKMVRKVGEGSLVDELLSELERFERDSQG